MRNAHGCEHDFILPSVSVCTACSTLSASTSGARWPVRKHCHYERAASLLRGRATHPAAPTLRNTLDVKCKCWIRRILAHGAHGGQRAAALRAAGVSSRLQ